MTDDSTVLKNVKACPGQRQVVRTSDPNYAVFYITSWKGIWGEKHQPGGPRTQSFCSCPVSNHLSLSIYSRPLPEECSNIDCTLDWHSYSAGQNGSCFRRL